MSVQYGFLCWDPGKSGGIAQLIGKKLWTSKMPDTESDIVDVTRRFVVACTLKKITPTVTIELVRGHQGMKSKKIKCPICKNEHYIKTGIPSSRAGVMMENFGILKGAALAFNCKLELPRPHDWQKAVGAGSRQSHASQIKWKNHLKGIAQRRFPDVKVTLQKSDALLILEWAKARYGVYGF